MVTFKEFLAEKCQNDEIYFYLHCRFLLFKGPELADTSNTFRYIHLVSLKFAEDLVELILQRYDQVNIMLIKK